MTGVLVLAGPTAAGKTALALEVAELVSGEIVSADSRQVYRGLDIGTAKPAPEELRRVRHHLIDLIDVRQSYSAGRFASQAGQAIDEIQARAGTPIVCGGTGFYIQALLEPLFEEPAAPGEQKALVRKRLAERRAAEGSAALHRDLALVDPDSANRLHPNDFQRVSRALELYYLTGRTLTELSRSAGEQTTYVPFTVILDLPLDRLEERIRSRTARMLDGAWQAEVAGLLAAGVPPRAPGMQSLGYPEVLELVAGRIGREEAFDRVVKKTRQYAKRQRTWFNKMAAALRTEPSKADPAEIVRRWHEHLEKLEGAGQ
ncbi:MAG: tRNA (adenosine(37)-N6)-dimethylallyltransferase MiaA [Candidatus Glassbacteria bacterium]